MTVLTAARSAPFTNLLHDMRRITGMDAGMGSLAAADSAHFVIDQLKATSSPDKINAGTMKPSLWHRRRTAPCESRHRLIPRRRPHGRRVRQRAGATGRPAVHRRHPSHHPDRYRAADSATHITKNTPPTLILQGATEHLVFAEHTKAFADELAAADITHRYVQLPFMEHGYDSSIANIGVQTTRALVLPWLRDRLGD